MRIPVKLPAFLLPFGCLPPTPPPPPRGYNQTTPFRANPPVNFSNNISDHPLHVVSPKKESPPTLKKPLTGKKEVGEKPTHPESDNGGSTLKKPLKASKKVGKPESENGAQKRSNVELNEEDDTESFCSDIPLRDFKSKLLQRKAKKRKPQQEISKVMKANDFVPLQGTGTSAQTTIPPISSRKLQPMATALPVSAPPELDLVPPSHSSPVPPKSTSAIQDTTNFSSPLLRWLRSVESHSHKSEDRQHSTQDTVVLPSSPTQGEREITEDSNPLSSLKPPPEPGKLAPSRNLTEAHLNLIRPVVSLLVFDLTNASSVKQMISFSNGSFTFLDSFQIDYLPFYEAVRAFISYHWDKECVEIEKKGVASPAYATRKRHQELMSCLCDAEKAMRRANEKVKNEREKVKPFKAKVEEIEEKLKQAEKEEAELEAELAAAQANEVLADEACSKAIEEVINMSSAMDDAEVEIECIEGRWDETMASIKRARDDLLLFQK